MSSTDKLVAVIEVGHLGSIVVVALIAVFVQVRFLDCFVAEILFVDIDWPAGSEGAVRLALDVIPP